MVVKDSMVFRIDKDSKLLWRYDIRTHHDVCVHDNGDIYVMIREPKLIPSIHPILPVLDDGILILDANGKPKSRFSLLNILRKSPYRFLLRSIAHLVPESRDGHLDMMHSNHVEVFDGKLERLGPLYKQGNLLISMRNNHSIAILDGETHAILWLWGPTPTYL